MADEVLTIKEVAALLKLAEKTVYAMAQTGEIPAFEIRGQWGIQRPEIDQWIDLSGAAVTAAEATTMAADQTDSANLIWRIAALLRGPYHPPQYERDFEKLKGDPDNAQQAPRQLHQGLLRRCPAHLRGRDRDREDARGGSQPRVV